MAIQTEPTRIQIPFADSGTKNVIPDTNSTPSASQAASWTDGFPAQCSLPLSAGGIPPARADFNGLFNTMSQSIRYGQEGGVWAWDATVDYGTSRMVLGSDSKIYWSVAQSGPNVGGAQDPTADDGTYWQAPSAKTMPPLENSAALATTEWVRDAMGTAPIYVDAASGDDSNDGLSAASAVKTIGQAVVLSKERTGGAATILVAGGTYSESVAVTSGDFVAIYLQGNVSITGGVSVGLSGVLYVQDGGGGYTLTISGGGTYPLYVYSNSTFWSGCAVSLSCGSSTAAAAYSSNGSMAFFSDAVSISTAGSGYALWAVGTSRIICASTVSIGGSGCDTAISIESSSYALFLSGLSMSINATDTALAVTNSSSVNLAGGTFALKGGKVGVSGFGSSVIAISSTVTAVAVSVATTGTNAVVGVSAGSAFLNNMSSGTLTLSAPSGNVAALRAQYASCIQGGAKITFSGTYSSAIVSCSGNSLIYIPSSATLSGSPTGTRYAVANGAQIYVHGGGANFIPGTAAGNAQAASYGYYG